MTRIIVGIPGKQAIHWENTFPMTKIPNKNLHTQVIKCDKDMVDCLFDACRKFDKSNNKVDINKI